ncbi:pyruvate ferredoxin/flavodoxin oxidoreductase, beta subunit [Methanobacterium lacus]|uniref:Pyruvate ferredoxin/flavodoxin oxidoreductase, beta subunit n=1 Tax=Methanobacterium lacus (strain AL-21) TaxID=877455 RepID=F0T8E3_METLA|nr:thiamine pyrophosphate-dependent enzyme [Methanobacterium lacus]ADZ09694.1 pyruvate ferredoxin/flavodoxin oxidoreductase, beta subunit [Methanobacterium lacus]
MKPENFDVKGADVSWCPGCGNFSILSNLKNVLADLEVDPENLVLVSGIGQAGKLPHFLRSNTYIGLHGRALSPATAIKAVNRGLKVIVATGDGDMYGEGGNHFLHTIRRNPDITCIVHDNMVYGLTKGQASPTTRLGMKTTYQVNGVSEEPFNPLTVAIALDASFVARTFSGDPEHLQKTLKSAINHEGYSLVDVFQPCVSFNKINTFQWFKENTYYLEESHDHYNKAEALRRAEETDKYPLGIFYINKQKKTFEETLNVYKNDDGTLHDRQVDKKKLNDLINSRRKL